MELSLWTYAFGSFGFHVTGVPPNCRIHSRINGPIFQIASIVTFLTLSTQVAYVRVQHSFRMLVVGSLQLYNL